MERRLSFGSASNDLCCRHDDEVAPGHQREDQDQFCAPVVEFLGHSHSRARLAEKSIWAPDEIQQ
jgi:hypothetical protein